MSQHDTGVKCPVCKKGKIVGESKFIPEPFTMHTPIGPGGVGGGGSTEIIFHCSRCQVLFHHPPGKPNAEDEARKMIERARAVEEGHQMATRVESVKRTKRFLDRFRRSQ